MATDNKTEEEKKDLATSLNGLQGYQQDSLTTSLVQTLIQKLNKTSNERKEYFRQLGMLRNNHVVSAIYDIIINDVIVSSGSTTNDFINITVRDNEKIEKELEQLFMDLNISETLQSVLPSLLHYGSYPLKPVFGEGGNKGLVSLRDEYDPESVIAITESDGDPLFYFVDNKPNSQENSYTSRTRDSFKFVPVDEVAYFSLDLDFIKLDVSKGLHEQFRKKVPDSKKNALPKNLKVKASKSLIWDVRDKLWEVLISNKVGVYKQLGKLLSPTVVGVPVPDSYDPAKMIEIVNKYDQIINGNLSKLGAVEDLNFTLQDVASVKVIPVSGNKGSTSPIDTGKMDRGSDSQENTQAVEELLSSLGINPDQYFAGRGRTSPTENMKINVRHAKKVKRIQRNISKCLVNLSLMHLAKKYPKKTFTADQIDIQLKNNVNMDELENLESQDLLVSSVSSMMRMFEDLERMAEGSEYEVDKNNLMDAVAEGLSDVGSRFKDVLVRKDEKPGETNE